MASETQLLSGEVHGKLRSHGVNGGCASHKDIRVSRCSHHAGTVRDLRQRTNLGIKRIDVLNPWSRCVIGGEHNGVSDRDHAAHLQMIGCDAAFIDNETTNAVTVRARNESAIAQ